MKRTGEMEAMSHPPRAFASSVLGALRWSLDIAQLHRAPSGRSRAHTFPVARRERREGVERLRLSPPTPQPGSAAGLDVLQGRGALEAHL